MALITVDVKPLDPYIYTGPTRMMSGPVRMRSVTADTAYGEFASWLYVGTTGNVSIVEWDGTTIVLNNLLAGVWHNIGSIMINSVGTAATGIVWGS